MEYGVSFTQKTSLRIRFCPWPFVILQKTKWLLIEYTQPRQLKNLSGFVLCVISLSFRAWFIGQRLSCFISVYGSCLKLKANASARAMQIHFIFFFQSSIYKIPTATYNFTPGEQFRHYLRTNSFRAFIRKGKFIAFFYAKSAICCFYIYSS
mgnify:CR=1 FL=1